MGVSVISLLPSTRGPALPIRARQRSSRPGQLFGLCRRKGRDDPRYSTVSERSLDHGAVGLSRPHSRVYGHAQHTRGKKRGRGCYTPARSAFYGQVIRRLSASPPSTQESSTTSSLELPLVVVAPVARVYPVIIVPIRMRGTEPSSVQPADRRVRVKQEAVLLVLQVLRLEKYPDVSLIVDGAEAGRSGPPEIPPYQGAARNFDVSPEGMDEVCEVSLICPRPAVVVWVAEIGIVRHFLAVEAADVVDDPLAEDAFVDHLLNVPIRRRLVHRERARAFGNDVHSRRPEPVGSLSLGALQRLDGAVEVLVYGPVAHYLLSLRFPMVNSRAHIL